MIVFDSHFFSPSFREQYFLLSLSGSDSVPLVPIASSWAFDPGKYFPMQCGYVAED